MEKPSIEKLDLHRKEGFRPGVVACLVHDKKILLVYKKDYKLWQLPQGGIENKEEPEAALKRMLGEELGEDFVKNVSFGDIKYVDEDQMEFKPGRHEVKQLSDDAGKEVPMLGKVYYFAALNVSTDELDIKKTQYDEHFWMSHMEANFLAEKIYQMGKRRITVKVLGILNNLGIIE